MPDFHKVCQVGDVCEGEGKVIKVGGKTIALFRKGDQFFAIDDMCPHMGASLSQGCEENGIVTCHWHGWRFRLSDGAWADYPRVKIGSYPVQIAGEDVHVQIDSSSTAGS